MRKGTAASVLLLTALVSGVGQPAAAGPGPAANAAPLVDRGPKRTEEFQRSVDRAIDRGVYWLLKQRKKSSQFGMAPGETALALYTLRACGVPSDDVVIEEGINLLRGYYGPKGKHRDTYGTALTLLALDAHFLEDVAPDDEAHARIPAKDKVWIQTMTRVLEKAQGSGGGFTYQSPTTGGHYDNSNSQYGILGLKAAARLGANVKRETWMRGLRHFLRDQMTNGHSVPRYEYSGVDEDGYGASKRQVAKDKARGWGYSQRSNPTGSMTTGGVSSLAICRSELLEDPAYDRALSNHVNQSIRDGIAWLGRQFSVKQNPGVIAWHYYYLYGLERAGVLAGVHLMEKHDWYGEGARYLVKEQQKDGGWASVTAFAMRRQGNPPKTNSMLQETCFALLFLKRATFTVKAKGTPTEADDEILDLSGVANLDDASFRPVFDAVFLRFRRAEVKRRTVLATDFVRLGVRALPLLLRCLDDEDHEVRAAAAAALRQVTGRSYGSPVGEGRRNVVANWEQWWVAVRRRVSADTAAGRFVVAKKVPPTSDE